MPWMPWPTPRENSASTAPTATGIGSGQARPRRGRHSAETASRDVDMPRLLQAVAVSPLEQRPQRIVVVVDSGVQVAEPGETSGHRPDREPFRIADLHL